MIRSESQLLCCCARVCTDAATVGHVRSLIQGEIDWPDLIRTATQHRVRPLVYRNLSQICPEAVPTVVLNELKKDFQSNAGRNLALTGELRGLLRLFQSHGIAALPFKGPTLAATVYGSLSLRHSGDLDILIHRRDALRCKDLLLARGYRLLTALTPYGFPVGGEFEYQFERPCDHLAVELRWRLTGRQYSAPLDLDRLIGSAHTIEFRGTPILALAPEELLLILCVHGAKHRWSCLMWICDVAELLRVYPEIDWSRVWKHASELGLWRSVVYGLLVAQETLGVQIPVAALRGTPSQAQLRPLAREARERLFIQPGSGDRNVLELRMGDARHWFSLLEALPDRARYGLQFILSFFHQLTPNEKDRLFLSLPAGLSFLYYLLRPVRLIREYVSPLLRSRTRS